MVNPILHELVATDPLRGKEVLLWAADGPDRHSLLEKMLRRGVDPNALYHSFIIKSKLDDVFATQGGRRGTAAPLRDEHLRTEIDRESDCRSSMYRTFIRRIHDHRFQHHFGPVADESSPECRYYWRWAPIHLAVSRGNDKAVAILLDHGAAIDKPSSGLCDCILPGVSSPEYTAPGRFHPVWTPFAYIDMSRAPSNSQAPCVPKRISPRWRVQFQLEPREWLPFRDRIPLSRSEGFGGYMQDLA